MRSYRWLSVFSKYGPGCFLLSVVAMLVAPSAAVVNVDGTRVIFNTGERVSAVSLINSEKQPVLVQLWSDMGDPLSGPESVRTPVLAVPPVFRMSPGEIRTVKLLLVSGEGLPRDRESLFWLNIYQVPPDTDGKPGEKQVVLPLRIRMKVFVRPEGVEKPEEQDGKRLRFLVRQSGETTTLRVVNPTPWYMTVTGLRSGGQEADTVMVAPGTEAETEVVSFHPGSKVTYQLINDSGNLQDYQAVAE